MCPTPAQVVLHAGRDVIARRMRILKKQCMRAHQHSGSAVAALEGAVIDESLLQRVNLAGVSETFDRDDVAPGDILD